MMLYLLFLLGMDPKTLGLADGLCVTVAIFIHFFGLCTFFWIGLEGIQLYRALVNMKMSDDDGKFSNLLRYVFGYSITTYTTCINIRKRKIKRLFYMNFSSFLGHHVQ